MATTPAVLTSLTTEWLEQAARPTFAPLRGPLTWWRDGGAGGPLLGHVTPMVVRVRMVFPRVTLHRNMDRVQFKAGGPA